MDYLQTGTGVEATIEGIRTLQEKEDDLGYSEWEALHSFFLQWKCPLCVRMSHRNGRIGV